MKLWSHSFKEGQAIPTAYAMGTSDPKNHARFSDNQNPHLAWEEIPQHTQSLVLIFHDKSAPTQADDVNKSDRLVPADLARGNFYHWVLVDIPPTLKEITAGSHSHSVHPKGKQGPQAPDGMRHGLNNYTQWFEGDESMQGQYFGYDGPFPPWNDSLIHHYCFTLYALDIPRLPVEGNFDATEVLKAMEGHVLAKAQLHGTYTINSQAQ
ncbi:MAG: YbhB/YbcL family Raf kinase inhibitor-like protein [Deltaproteobacteria bacterium]|nr:YbhB/YbcL family Raf kinase inhibitor-like protein [Deltaproteobacteria bacterium]